MKFLLLTLLASLCHTLSVPDSGTFSGTQMPIPMKPKYSTNHGGEVFISILTELSGNLWLGFVSSLYADSNDGGYQIQRGECFGAKTFNHMKELTRITSASNPKEFYNTLASIVMQMYSLGLEVKDSCKFERIYTDLKEYCS